METVKLKHEILVKAFKRFEEAVSDFEQVKNSDEKKKFGFLEYDKQLIYLRESMIQRFEYTTDCFWKYLNLYLEKVIEIPSEINGPKHVIRTACKAKLICEEDTKILLDMIGCRNKTSHIYNEDVAELICDNIPEFYKLMKKQITKLSP